MKIENAGIVKRNYYEKDNNQVFKRVNEKD